MKFYFSGGENNGFKVLKQCEVEHVMFSFYNVTEKNMDDYIKYSKGSTHKLMIDSGAFSAMQNDTEIDIKEYCQFLWKYASVIHKTVCLDVIGDYKKTLINHRFMFDRGINSMWVYHYGGNEPLELLKEMASEHDYIGLGAVGGISKMKKKNIYRLLDDCFSVIPSTTKVHGFAIGQLDLLKKYPFYSVDSTYWLNGSNYGNVLLFEKGKLKFMNTDIYNREKRNIMNVWTLQDIEKYITDDDYKKSSVVKTIQKTLFNKELL